MWSRGPVRGGHDRELDRSATEKNYIYIYIYKKPIPLAARSKAWVWAVRLLGLWVRIPPGAWMSVCCECCVLPGTGLCIGLITRPGESDRVCCVQWVWSRGPVMGGHDPELDRSAKKKKRYIYTYTPLINRLTQHRIIKTLSQLYISSMRSHLQSVYVFVLKEFYTASELLNIAETRSWLWF